MLEINIATLKNQMTRNIIPDAETAVKIASVLSTTVEFLVTGQNEPAIKSIMDFYERVKKLVKDKTDLTLRAFIESLGINYDSYNGLKRYSNLPRADEAVKIADALGTSVEHLVTGREQNKAAQELQDLKQGLFKLLQITSD